MIKLHLNKFEAENHYQVVKTIIQNRINNILNGKIGSAENPVSLSSPVKKYLTSLLLGENLKALILAEPKELIGIIMQIKSCYPNFVVEDSEDNKVIENLFVKSTYDNKAFKKLDFIKRINLDTCAYCNRNYIYFLSGINGGDIKPEIDHFFPKSIYPFLGVSFYNLIPSCETCNGFQAKGQKDPLVTGLINPYLLEDYNFKFTYDINNINVLNPFRDKHSIKVKFAHKIQEHIEIFKLEKLYEQHADHVLELIIKSKIEYSEHYRNYLKSYKKLNFDDVEINNMILGNYSLKDDQHKRPLSKLYQDIGMELALII